VTLKGQGNGRQRKHEFRQVAWSACRPATGAAGSGARTMSPSPP